MNQSPTTTFHPVLRVIHWLMAIAVLAMLFIGVAMVSTVTSTHNLLLAIHKPLGFAIGLLVILRIGLRRHYGIPPLPASVPGWQRGLAHLSHFLLYFLMLAQPLTGWAMLSAAGYPATLWSGFVLPPLTPASVELYALLRPLHTLLALLLFAIILGHIAAALLHALLLRDGVFSSMACIHHRQEP